MYPDLPEYSEKGLNVGGFFLNEQAWITDRYSFLSRQNTFSLYSYPAGDSIVIYWNGNYKDSVLRSNETQQLFIVLKNIKIEQDEDLYKLSGRTILLDGITNYGGFTQGYYSSEKIGHGTGKLSFGNVGIIKNVKYDPDSSSYYAFIVPGRFEMNMYTNKNYTITLGRFDMKMLRNDNIVVVL